MLVGPLLTSNLNHSLLEDIGWQSAQQTSGGHLHQTWQWQRKDRCGRTGVGSARVRHAVPVRGWSRVVSVHAMVRAPCTVFIAVPSNIKRAWLLHSTLPTRRLWLGVYRTASARTAVRYR